MKPDTPVAIRTATHWTGALMASSQRSNKVVREGSLRLARRKKNGSASRAIAVSSSL